MGRFTISQIHHEAVHALLPAQLQMLDAFLGQLPSINDRAALEDTAKQYNLHVDINFDGAEVYTANGEQMLLTLVD